MIDSHELEHEILGLDKRIKRLVIENAPVGGGGIPNVAGQDHSTLDNLDYASAGHTGFLQDANDVIKDTHIDWGIGVNQVSADDIPDGSTNIIPTSTQESNWDTAYGWGNHADAGYVTGTPWTSEGYLTEETDPIFSAWDKSTGISITESQISDFGTYLTDITGESIGDLSDVTLTPTKTLTITESTTLSGGTHSGTNTGDQVIPDNEAGSANNFLTAYNNATGAWTKAQPTWANIDKTTSDIADLTTKSHTSLTDIGTLTHATIDSYLDQAVKVASSPKFASVEITDAGRVGFLGNKAHIQFDDEAVDTISMMYANIGVGTTTPAPFVAGSTCLDFTSTNNMEMIFDHTDAGVGSVLGDLNFARADTLLAQIRGAIDGANDAAYISITTKPTGGALTERMRITSKGNVTIGNAALATNATDGFLYIPTCAGTPTGTPTAYTGRVAMVFDTTNNKAYIYDGGWIALN